MKTLRNHNLTSNGFVLVVTLVLMILLSILALGMLGLSSITLRTSGGLTAQREARSNARLALILAIGELQKHAGSDMRVTATADIVAADNPPLLGVWRSWEGSDHVASGNTLAGRPLAPDYASKDKPVSQGGRFVSWLVSGADADADPGDAASLVSSTGSSGTIPLVSTGSLADGDAREVHVVPRQVGDHSTMAWWVSGENQKARLPKPYADETPSIADWADRNRSHAIADPEPFHLDDVLDDPSLPRKALTLATADIIAGDGVPVNPHENFHDLSATSVGLLTNTATGGWRKDLSLLTESWEAQPSGGLELFQLKPDENLEFTRPTYPDNYRPPGSLLYSWSDYRDHRSEQTFHHRGPVSSWTGLANYASLYKEVSSSSSSLPKIDHQSWPYRGHPHMLNGLHKTWVMPQITRVQFLASHYATSEGAAPGKLRPAVLYTPIITLWNPFNTELTLNGKLHIRTGYARPLALKYTLTGVSNTDFWAVEGPQTGNSYPDNRLQPGWSYGFQIKFDVSPLVLKPGETRVFSPKDGFIKDGTYVTSALLRSGAYHNVDLLPGVRLDAGVYFALDRILQPGLASPADADPEKVSLPPGTNLNVDAKFDAAGQNIGGAACGLFFQWNINRFGDPQHGNVTAHYRPDQADELYPPLENLASVSLAECEDNPIPFLSMIYGSRIANHKATPTKGMVQANPLVTFTATGINSWHSDPYPGGQNPLNAPWDFSFVPHPSGPGDDMLPNVDNTTNSGYIITGVRKAEGIARCVMSELPTRPLASLGDLTHWHMRGLNPVPPFGNNLIANSDATPLIAMDAVVNPNNLYANTTNNEQQDDSYCANHILFDDWFFSSIAPDPDGFGPGGRGQRDNYIGFLTGDEPLTNRAYRPITEDRVTDPADAGDIFDEHVAPLDSWKSIASRFEVEGMFNVNSTSVKAWRALLGHARNQRIPYAQDNGEIALSGETDYAFPRTSVAGDEEAGNPKAGAYFATTEFAGYRVFTDEMLDELAENIVDQVQSRGPFLSLSEFVNRQLSRDKNLALAGAIQTALNELSDTSSLNPFDIMQDESAASSSDPPGNDDYAFPDAGAGFNTYGLPGWTRQADVLRPLAPILSARDDTFKIRAYGDSRGADGKVRARAWCEATVRRKRNFVDASDPAEMTGMPSEDVNRIYGRRFQLVSFRWLNAKEV